MIRYYNRDGTPMIPNEGESDMDVTMRWARMFENDNRIVRKTRLPISGYLVSTVFLGMNHSFNALDERPLIFETMVFGDEKEMELPALPEADIPAQTRKYREDLYQDRYSTEKQAVRGHWWTVWTYFWIGIQNKFTAIINKTFTFHHKEIHNEQAQDTYKPLDSSETTD